MKTTEPISPLNKHLSWISFSDRRQWKGGGKKKNKGSPGNKELIKNSEAARLIPEREKNKTAAQAYTDETKEY